MIVAAEDPDHFLGTVGWRLDLPPPLRIADIGYAVHPDSRGTGRRDAGPSARSPAG